MNFRSAIGACCISLIAAVGTQAAVDDYDALIPISELQAKFERTGDKTYQYFVQARCAGGYLQLSLTSSRSVVLIPRRRC